MINNFYAIQEQYLSGAVKSNNELAKWVAKVTPQLQKVLSDWKDSGKKTFLVSGCLVTALDDKLREILKNANCVSYVTTSRYHIMLKTGITYKASETITNKITETIFLCGVDGGLNNPINEAVLEEPNTNCELLEHTTVAKVKSKLKKVSTMRDKINNMESEYQKLLSDIEHFGK